MIEVDVIRCLNQIPLTVPVKYIVDSDNGIHPMDELFCLVGLITEDNMGTPTKTLTSRNDSWAQSQSKVYEVRISYQGRKNQYVSDICEEMKMLLTIPPIRQIFMDAGYTYDVDIQTICIPIQLNTDQYVRYSFTVNFKTSKTILFSQNTIEKVNVNGEFTYGDGLLIEKYEEDIP